MENTVEAMDMGIGMVEVLNLYSILNHPLTIYLHDGGLLGIWLHYCCSKMQITIVSATEMMITMPMKALRERQIMNLGGTLIMNPDR